MELQDLISGNVKEIYILLTTITAIVGLYSTYRQWSKSLSLKRANYVYELCNKISTNELIRDVLYLIDYNINWYTNGFHSSGVNQKNNADDVDNDKKTSIEAKVDYTLTYFSYICYLYKKQIIIDEDFVFFKYDLQRMCTNYQVKNYLYNIYHFADKIGTSCTFYYLIDYAYKNGLIDSDFFDNKSYKTGKYQRNINI